MASVDLNGGDAQQIRGAYSNYLGRNASDDEVSGWLSGSYGGGGLNDWISQISNSGEARNRAPQIPNQPQLPPGAQTIGQNPQTNHGYDQPSDGGPDANFSGALGKAYEQYLGRSASPDEINNWWSGQYGYGQGWNGFNQMREAIRSSGEARNRNGGQAAPEAYYQDTSYWKGQGVNEGDILDLTTGQLKPGWARTAKGYERTGGSQTQTGGGNNADLQAYVRSLLSGVSSPQALAALETQLNQRGIKLQKDSYGNIRGRIYLPDGTAIDLVNQWGQPWAWNERGKSGDGPGGGGAPGDQYSDPYTKFLEQLIKSRIGNLGPVNDPNRSAYESALNQRAQALSTGNAQLDQLMKYLQERFTDLKGPGYTGAENEAIRTGALDPIENDRAAAKKRMMERLSAMGHTPDSGVYQMAMQEVDKEFDQMRAASQNQLTTNDLARRENRSQRAEAIGAQIADIPELRAREQLDVFQALNNLSLMARQEDNARANEAIQYGGVLSDLGPNRLNLAMQAAGMGGNGSGLSSLLSQIAGMNQQGQAYGAQNNQAMWSGLGSLAAIIARSGQSGLSGYGI